MLAPFPSLTRDGLPSPGHPGLRAVVTVPVQRRLALVLAPSGCSTPSRCTAGSVPRPACRPSRSHHTPPAWGHRSSSPEPSARPRSTWPSHVAVPAVGLQGGLSQTVEHRTEPLLMSERRGAVAGHDTAARSSCPRPRESHVEPDRSTCPLPHRPWSSGADPPSFRPTPRRSPFAPWSEAIRQRSLGVVR